MAALVDTCGWIEWLTDGVLADAFEVLQVGQRFCARRLGVGYIEKRRAQKACSTYRLLNPFKMVYGEEIY